MDVVSKAVRSRMMSSIRGRDTKPELHVRRHLHGRGFRFRLNRNDLPGKPDLILPRWNTAIFVHGCFWHQHKNCPYAVMPKTRPEFWQSKLAANSARDVRSVQLLQELSWRVIVVWECSLRNAPELTMNRLEEAIRSDASFIEI